MAVLEGSGGDVRAALVEKLVGEEFSCVAAKTAVLRSTIVHRHFGVMGTPSTTADLHAALADFARRKDEIDLLLATFVATFSAPVDVTEEEFEDRLWRQLGALHLVDVENHHEWDPSVDADPESPRFGFSIGGHAFFVVGMHANASRITRRFERPTLVFNSHVQFERLKARGVYDRIKVRVREREMGLQGSLNPNLAEFGTASEAAQYSGRAVESGWECPFEPQVTVYSGSTGECG